MALKFDKILSEAASIGTVASDPNVPLTLGRGNGYASIKADSSNGGYLILDSKDNFLSLNHYVNKPVALGIGGGNVGVGITNPDTKLHVVGNAKFWSGASSGQLTVGRGASQELVMYVNDNDNSIIAYQDSDSNQPHRFILNRSFAGSGANDFVIQKEGDDQFKIDTSGHVYINQGLNVETDGTAALVLGADAYTQSANYIGLKTTTQAGVNDYMIISGVNDASTYVSAGDNATLYLRGGGNNSANQIAIPDGSTMTVTTSLFNISNPHAKLKLYGTTHANLEINRGSTSYDANILFMTNNSINWRIWNNGSSDTLGIRDEANANEMVTFKTGGKVGINTTSPSNRLTIANNYVYETSTTVHNNPAIKFLEDSGSTYISPLQHGLYISTSPPKGASRAFLADGATKSVTSYHTGGSTGDFRIYTGSGTTGSIIQEHPRMIVTNSGNLGLGTLAPNYKFEVYGESPYIMINNTAETQAGLLFQDSADSGQSAGIKYNSSDNSLRFYNHSMNTERMAIYKDGTVKIGGHRGFAVRSIDDSNYFSFNDESTTGDFYQQLPYTGGNGSVAKVDDPTAPAPGCFEVTGSYNSDIHSSNRYIKVDINAEYTWEMYVKFVSGTDTDQRIYLGWGMWDANKTYFGNTQRYWGGSAVQVDADSNNSDWVLIRGTISGVGTDTGQFISGTEYVAPLVLLNYSSNANVIRICGLRLYKSSKNASKIQLGRSGAASSGTLPVNTEYTATRCTLENNNNDILRVRNDHGYIEMGPANSGHAHIQTDRTNFYFNREIRVDGGTVSSYNEDLKLATANANTPTTRIQVKRDTGRVGINTDSPASLLHMSSGTSGDAVLTIEADTDNNNEEDNPRIELLQDGGQVRTTLGTNGNPGSIYTGSLANAAYLITNTSYLQLGTNSAARITIDGETTTINGYLSTSLGADRYIRAYHSDGSYVRMHGYGLYMSRNSSYIRPTANNSQSLNIGWDGNNWSYIRLVANTSIQFMAGTNHYATMAEQYLQVPKGTTAARDSFTSGVAGMFRFNTTNNKFEGHNGTEWGNIGGDDYAPLTVVKDGYNRFQFDFGDAINFKFDASGTWHFVPATITNDLIGKSGVIIINNTGTTNPGALPSNFKTPNGDNIVWETDSGDTAIVSYFIVSPSIVLINYIGNFG